ncbi:hypothetical protein HMPREF9120_00096 [Neisseria sp. oral taxon 020 str. F0370]|nr:hypothetical protein HMPREF9120_00096 [Neisseria sp. oral taxon 020 str. F0370]
MCHIVFALNEGKTGGRLKKAAAGNVLLAWLFRRPDAACLEAV